jgi:hypothetical protein
MKLTKEEIQDLYTFTRKHFVEHYDLQTELVDHLANDIEQMWREQPKLGFEDARDKAFKKFGVFGFMDAIEQKQKALRKKYTKILFQHAKEWFKLPKILTTIMIFLFFYISIQNAIGIYFFSVAIIGLVIVEFYYAFKLKKRANQRFKTNGRKWMLEEMIFNVAAMGNILICSNLPNFFNHILKDSATQLQALFVALLLTLTIIYSYITLMVLPAKADELLSEQYPEFSL